MNIHPVDGHFFFTRGLCTPFVRSGTYRVFFFFFFFFKLMVEGLDER